MDAKIKVIVFDLGRVLVDFDHRIAAKKIAAICRKTPEQIFDLFFDSKLIQSFEEGNILPEEFFREVRATLGLEISFQEFLPIWNRIFYLTDENKAVYALGRSLRLGRRLALLSNINTLHYEYLRENFPVFDIFHDIFLSCEMGCIKPSPKIYDKLIAALAVMPEEIFYTDDRQELIDQANNMGMRGFVFQGAEKLKKDLLGCGVDAAARGGDLDEKPRI